MAFIFYSSHMYTLLYMYFKYDYMQFSQWHYAYVLEFYILKPKQTGQPTSLCKQFMDYQIN